VPAAMVIEDCYMAAAVNVTPKVRVGQSFDMGHGSLSWSSPVSGLKVCLHFNAAA